jgi:uncharacterized Fe-S radical SAM superfamily protein PflX
METNSIGNNYLNNKAGNNMLDLKLKFVTNDFFFCDLCNRAMKIGIRDLNTNTGTCRNCAQHKYGYKRVQAVIDLNKEACLAQV